MLSYKSDFPLIRLNVLSNHHEYVEDECDSHKEDIRVAHIVLLFIIHVKLSEAEHMVTRDHCHHFIEDFFQSFLLVKIGFNTYNKYNVEGGEEAQNLNL